MRNQSLPPCYTLPRVDNGYGNAPEYSLERTYNRLLQRPDIDVVYSPKRTDSLVVALGVAENKADSVQAIASALYLAMKGGEVDSELIEKNLLALGSLAYDVCDEIGHAKERIREDMKEALGEKIE